MTHKSRFKVAAVEQPYSVLQKNRLGTMKERSTDWHYLLALVSVGVSIFCLTILAISLPWLHTKTNEEYLRMSDQSHTFREITNRLWAEKMQMISKTTVRSVIMFSRHKRDPFGGFCKGCFQLACPQGPSGPPGSPGPDGRPGESGNQGMAGDDGYDVQLESEPEMPCVVCPSGPPGPRGAQGERGRQGEAGQIGERGPHGNPGMDGPQGPPGTPGRMGPKGPEGARGQEGKTAVAGVGIKGPKGPAGPMGMKGPPGPPGRSSTHPGETGAPGESGPMGPPGRAGTPGLEGAYGPPGEPGMPASYCPSDCGVQQILANVLPDHSVNRHHSTMDVAKHDDTPYYHDKKGGYAALRSYTFLRDDPVFRAKLARKMRRRMNKNHLRVNVRRMV